MICGAKYFLCRAENPGNRFVSAADISACTYYIEKAIANLIKIIHPSRLGLCKTTIKLHEHFIIHSLKVTFIYNKMYLSTLLMHV